MTVEDIILQKGHRGMDVLRPHAAPDFCRTAAQQLYALPRGRVLFTTGFYVAGHPESDGPAGTVCLAATMKALGFDCTILADENCAGLLDWPGVESELFPAGAVDAAAVLDKYTPVALVSIERCGRNAAGDYANMHGISIAEHTAALDSLFPEAERRGIFTLGVGDGGNEIGMGNMAEIINRQLALSPCVVCADTLVLATVSNWGAYGLAACLSKLEGRDLMPENWLPGYLEASAAIGCVDGVNHEAVPTVDGYPAGTENEVFEQLRRWIGEN